MKSILDSSELLEKELYFAKYFLKMFNFNTNDIVKFKHKQLVNTDDDGNEISLNYFEDSFYEPFSQLNGINLNFGKIFVDDETK